MILFRYQWSAVTKSVFAIVNLKTAKQIGLTIPPECAGEGGQGDQITLELN